MWFGVRSTLDSMSVPTKNYCEFMDTSHKHISSSTLHRECFPSVFVMAVLTVLTNLSHHPPHQLGSKQLNLQVGRTCVISALKIGISTASRVRSCQFSLLLNALAAHIVNVNVISPLSSAEQKAP